MIKKYQSFFESITIKLSSERAFKIFCETLIDCQDYLSHNSNSRAYSSYSYVSQENRGDLDPEIDFSEINEYMSENGWDLENVNQLVDGVSNFTEKIERENISRTAAIDYYLYKITNEEFPLQGYEWDLRQMDDPDPEINEFVIRFSYGWHKTRYGKLAILQNMKSIKDFILTSFKYIHLCIFGRVTSMYSLDFTEEQKEKIIKNFFFDKDINEIYIDSDNLFSELKELSPSRRSLYSSERHGTPIEKEKLLSLSQSQFDDIIVNMLLKFELKARVVTTGDIKATVS